MSENKLTRADLFSMAIGQIIGVGIEHFPGQARAVTTHAPGFLRVSGQPEHSTDEDA